MGNVVKVGMADLKVAKNPDSLITLGLGSCVGVALYDPVSKVGGLLHAMLPDSTQIRQNSNKAKFVDTGLDLLLEKMAEAGASKSRIRAKLAGGAKMFAFNDNTSLGGIGDRNVDAAKRKLKELGIRIIAEDTGLNYGRTVELFCENGDYHIRSVGKVEKTI